MKEKQYIFYMWLLSHMHEKTDKTTTMYEWSLTS